MLNIAPFLDKYAKIIKESYGKSVELFVVCNAPLNYNFKNILLKNIKWSRGAAINGILESHIGIMPLMDNRYSKANGWSKLGQNLSAVLPCIGSDVGFNKEVIDPCCGRLVKGEVEWGNALLYLADLYNWEQCSDNAYSRWLNKFSFIDNFNIWKDTLRRITNDNKWR